jgi:hypothetical protein
MHGTHTHRPLSPVISLAQVFVLWPDDGTWYRGTVKKFSPTERTAVIYYDDTGEKESADLGELVGEGQIAFSE